MTQEEGTIEIAQGQHIEGLGLGDLLKLVQANHDAADFTVRGTEQGLQQVIRYLEPFAHVISNLAGIIKLTQTKADPGHDPALELRVALELLGYLVHANQDDRHGGHVVNVAHRLDQVAPVHQVIRLVNEQGTIVLSHGAGDGTNGVPATARHIQLQLFADVFEQTQRGAAAHGPHIHPVHPVDVPGHGGGFTKPRLAVYQAKTGGTGRAVHQLIACNGQTNNVIDGDNC